MAHGARSPPLWKKEVLRHDQRTGGSGEGRRAWQGSYGCLLYTALHALLPLARTSQGKGRWDKGRGLLFCSIFRSPTAQTVPPRRSANAVREHGSRFSRRRRRRRTPHDLARSFPARHLGHAPAPAGKCGGFGGLGRRWGWGEASGVHHVGRVVEFEVGKKARDNKRRDFWTLVLGLPWRRLSLAAGRWVGGWVGDLFGACGGAMRLRDGSGAAWSLLPSCDFSMHDRNKPRGFEGLLPPGLGYMVEMCPPAGRLGWGRRLGGWVGGGISCSWEKKNSCLVHFFIVSPFFPRITSFPRGIFMQAQEKKIGATSTRPLLVPCTRAWWHWCGWRGTRTATGQPKKNQAGAGAVKASSSFDVRTPTHPCMHGFPFLPAPLGSKEVCGVGEMCGLARVWAFHTTHAHTRWARTPSLLFPLVGGGGRKRAG